MKPQVLCLCLHVALTNPLSQVMTPLLISAPVQLLDKIDAVFTQFLHVYAAGKEAGTTQRDTSWVKKACKNIDETSE